MLTLSQSILKYAAGAACQPAGLGSRPCGLPFQSLLSLCLRQRHLKLRGPAACCPNGFNCLSLCQLLPISVYGNYSPKQLHLNIIKLLNNYGVV